MKTNEKGKLMEWFINLSYKYTNEYNYLVYNVETPINEESIVVPIKYADAKIKYIENAYDENFRLKTNSDVCIKDIRVCEDITFQ